MLHGSILIPPTGADKFLAVYGKNRPALKKIIY
jgi:hypothetical protein